eukprot:jgi/Phyca11/505624/fgenesh2_kg.PHYCAscaffold_14_\
MDQVITAVPTPTTHEALTSGVITDLVSLGRCAHADELARALAVVSQCYSVPVPSSAASAIQKALTEVSDLLQHHRLYASDSAPSVYKPEQCVVIENGLRLLWAHVTTYQLHAALVDLVRTIDFMPRSVVFWKQLRKRTVREILQRGPMQWLLSRAQRVTVGEKIRSLEETLEAHLVLLDRGSEDAVNVLRFCFCLFAVVEKTRHAERVNDKVFEPFHGL